jgi:hypothetical protein
LFFKEGISMSFSWQRMLRPLLVVGLVVCAGSTAFGLDSYGRPQSPIESLLSRGTDNGMVIPVSAEQPIGCTAAPSCGSAPADTCCDGSSWCGNAINYFAPGSNNCGCNTVTVAGELLFLKPFQSDGNYGDFNYRAGYRLWASWQRPDGLGVRVRYFDYNQTAVNGDNIDLNTLDLEVMDSYQLGCNWTLIVAGGIRFLDLNSNAANNGTDIFHGFGPVVTAELYRTINYNTQLYAITRYSVLVDDGANVARGAQDVCMSTLEIQLGVQRTRELANGALAFGRVGWEAQQYDDASDSEESIVLHGFAFTLGAIY